MTDLAPDLPIKIKRSRLQHDHEENSGSGSGSGSDSDSAANSDDDAAADSLDSPRASRKKRKISAVERVEPLTTSFHAPSRINTKGAVKEVNSSQLDDKLTAANHGLISVPLDAQTSFADLNLQPWLVRSLANMAIKRPTGIQKACIPEILKGRDCIGGSRTGSGKTVAFAVPILQKWAEDPFGIFAVVLTPTR